MTSSGKPWAFWLAMSFLAIVLVACGAAVTSDTVAEEQPALVVDEGPQNNVDVVDPEEESESGQEASTAKENQTEKTAENNADAEETSGDEEGAAEEASEQAETEDPPSEEMSDDPASVEPETVAEDGILTVDDRSERQRMISELWNTDFSRHTVPYDELLALLPVRDGIPAIDNPTFETLEEATEWLFENEPVIAVEYNGDARAYPLQVLTWHEIVNDTVGEIPVVVTFCPLCNSALVFDRRLNGETYDFGTSGWLRHSDLVMYDRTTESMWQQFTGEGIVGELAGEQLTFLPSSIISFANFSEAYPEGIVLSNKTGFGRPYGQNPYPGYDRIGENPFAFIGVPDSRLAAMERVITVSLDQIDVAYPLLELADAGVINDAQGGQDLVVFHVGGTASALDASIIFMGDDVGATGVFDPNLDGQKLTFSKDGDVIMDDETGSTWNIVGQAFDGPLAGSQLAPVVHGDHFWFSWAAFKPDTIIYGS
jgi:hypothetical protein